MHALFRQAPEPPRLLAFEHAARPRQVVGRIPMIEFLAQMRGNDGADEEEGGGHGFYASAFVPSFASSSGNSTMPSWSLPEECTTIQVHGLPLSLQGACGTSAGTKH